MFVFLVKGFIDSSKKSTGLMLWGFFYYTLLTAGLLIGLSYAVVMIFVMFDVIGHHTPTETEWDIR